MFNIPMAILFSQIDIQGISAVTITTCAGGIIAPLQYSKIIIKEPKAFGINNYL
jgi:hypothetical protein